MVAFWFGLDERELRYETDIEAYFPSTEAGIRRFERLLEISTVEVERERLPDLQETGSSGNEEVEWEERREALIEHASTIEANFENLRPLLPTLEELGDGEPIGDSMTSFDSELVGFATLRNMCRGVVEHAEWSVADPSVEPQLEHLFQLHQMARSWVNQTRSLVHVMLAVVVLQNTTDSFERLLPRLGDSQLERVGSMLEPSMDYAPIVARRFYGEYCMAYSALEQADDDWQRSVPFLYHRNRTFNWYGDLVARLIELTEEGELATTKVFLEGKYAELEAFQLRNYIGVMFLRMAIPAVTKVLENAAELTEKEWRLREAARARLGAGL